MRAYIAEFQAIAAPLAKFCTVAKYHRFDGFTADALALVTDLRRWMFERGCDCSIRIITDPRMKKWSDMDLAMHPDDGMHEMRSFSTPADATAWLATRSIQITPEELRIDD